MSDGATVHGRIAVRVYYEDTDASGIVYHANYLRIIERGRTELLRDLGLDHRSMLDAAEPTAYAVRRMEINYLAPARIDDLLQVETSVRTVTGARLVMDQWVRSAAGKALFTARVEIACLSREGKPRRLPEAARRAFAAVTVRHTNPLEAT